MRKPFIKNSRRVVVKVGTSVLTRGKRFDVRVIDELAAQASALIKKGVEVTLVSSGAIGAGMALMRMRKRPTRMEALQAAAAVGQRYLMQCWEEAFKKRGFSTAQVLLTWDDLASQKRFLNAKRTLHQIHTWKHVPIINENDTVATDEIRFGDNDRLSSLLAILLEADALVILSSVDGLYAGGLMSARQAHIKVVYNVDESTFAHVKDSEKMFTMGGMRAKLNAIRMSTHSGIPVFLVNGREKSVLTRLLKGEELGTFFLPRRIVRRKNDWVKDFLSHVASKERARA